MAAPFITAATLGSYLGRDLSADTGATQVVAAACGMCRTVAEQEFTLGTSTAVLDGTDTDALLLPQAPVSAIGTVQIVSTEGTATLAATDYVASPDGMLFTSAIAGSWATWPGGRQNVRVSYTHGYGTADFPEEVRMVALAAASRLLIQGPASGETVGGASITYALPSTDLTDGEKAILRKYKRTH